MQRRLNHKQKEERHAMRTYRAPRRSVHQPERGTMKMNGAARARKVKPAVCAES